MSCEKIMHVIGMEHGVMMATNPCSNMPQDDIHDPVFIIHMFPVYNDNNDFKMHNY